MPITIVSGEQISSGKVENTTRKFTKFIGKNILILIGVYLLIIFWYNVFIKNILNQNCILLPYEQ